MILEIDSISYLSLIRLTSLIIELDLINFDEARTRFSEAILNLLKLDSTRYSSLTRLISNRVQVFYKSNSSHLSHLHP